MGTLSTGHLQSAMPPKRVTRDSDGSDSSTGDDGDLVWQDGIDWENCAATRGLKPSLCVRTRILISLTASRLVTVEQRRRCWEMVGDFPLNENLVLEAMGASKEGNRRSSRHVISSAAEAVRDIAFDSQESDGTFLRKAKKLCCLPCAINRFNLSPSLQKSPRKLANRVLQTT